MSKIRYTCLTVKQLKEYVKDLPELDSSGDPAEVWMQSGVNESCQVMGLCRLNSTDLLVECDDGVFKI